MPAKSAAQRCLMAAALHGADFPKAKAVRSSMTTKQLRDFARPGIKPKTARKSS